MANDTANVALTELHAENRGFSTRNLGKHHLIRKLNQLTNNEFEKLCSAWERCSHYAFAQRRLKILRHSDIRLTMNRYTDDTLLPTVDAIGKMPSFGCPDAQQNRVKGSASRGLGA